MKIFEYKYLLFRVKVSYGLLILLAVLSRVLPHMPNVTAMTSLSLLLATQLPRRIAISIIIFTQLLSDIILSYISNYTVFGSWSFFTYTGFIIVMLLTRHTVQLKSFYLIALSIYSALLFWLWTNLGTWIFTNMYIKNFNGLLSCYFAALPFLRNQMLGDIAWMIIILAMFKLGNIFFIKTASIKATD